MKKKHTQTSTGNPFKPRGRISLVGEDCPHLAEDQIDLYAEALFTIAQKVFEVRRATVRKPFMPNERFGLRQESVHDVALIVGECAALLKLHLTDRITVENKVIEHLVKPVPELIPTPQR
jgi:hypothetical protein